MEQQVLVTSSAELCGFVWSRIMEWKYSTGYSVKETMELFSVKSKGCEVFFPIENARQKKQW